MNKKLIVLSFLFIILLPLSSVSLAEDDSFLFKVAVLAFDDSPVQNRWWGSNWDVGKGVAEMFITELINTRKFRVIEREQLDTILKEQRISASGLINSQTAAELGRILGVKYLIIGKVTEFSSDSDNAAISNRNSLGFAIKTTTARVSIDIRLVETSTAEIKVSVTGKGEKKKTNLGVATSSGVMMFGSNEFLQTNLGEALRIAVNSAAVQLSQKAYEGVRISTQIISINNDKIYIDGGADKGLQKGMIFEVNHVIDEIVHPDTKEVLDQITETVAEIVIIEVRPKVSICSIISQTGDITIKDQAILSQRQTSDIGKQDPITNTIEPIPTERPAGEKKQRVDWK